MEEQSERDASSTEDLTRQLERTVSDLRTLAETMGAVPGGSAPRAATRRQMIVSSVVLFIVVAAVSWFIWEHWHSVVALGAPLVWVVSHSLRWRRGRRPVLTEPSERITSVVTERERDGGQPGGQ
jgi:hypothetical protein